MGGATRNLIAEVVLPEMAADGERAGLDTNWIGGQTYIVVGYQLCTLT